MLSKVIFVLVCASAAQSCSLSTLYKDVDRQILVKGHLDPYFDHKYTEVIREAIKAPYLLRPAEFFKKKIRHKFSEYGSPLNNLEDLETLLLSFNYLQHEDFQVWKLDWDRLKRKQR